MAQLETRTEPMVVNFGPHHPSMHGVLRLVVTLDGENVIDCEPVIGYLHRGMEKIAENRTNVMYVPYVCLLYTSPSPRDKRQSRMPSSA